MMHTGVITLNLELALTKAENSLAESERIRKDLVETNRILTVAVQQARDLVKLSFDSCSNEAYFILYEAEKEVKKIATKDEKNASNY